MTRIDTERPAHARPGPPFAASDRPLPPATAGEAIARRARLAVSTIALAAVVAGVIAAPMELLLLLVVAAITVVVVGGAFLLVERRNRPRDGARPPSYFTPDHLTRRKA